jgi:lipopolysaccharide transport system ATP-binding protein
MKPAIRIENLSKLYQLGALQEGGYRTLREAIMDPLTAAFRRARQWSPWRGGRRPMARRAAVENTIWALKDVSLDIRPGDVVGVVGRNGAGKSTLLKILSRITEPTAGRVELRGRVGSLLEVGTGFHPELSGRENIYLNGAILGMSRREITAKFDEIVSFAEIERFLDTPVKRYSSGMYVRLAFAVAAHLEPEILIVDEVLAVGDASFQKKCLNKMHHVAGHGRTVLFVSHNMGAVQTLCRSAVLLDHGRVRHAGTTRDVVAAYLQDIDETSSLPIGERTDRNGAGRFQFDDLTVLDADGFPCSFAATGENMSLRVRLKVKTPGAPLSAPLDIAILLRDFHGNRVTTLASYFTGTSPTRIGETCEIRCTVPNLPLLAGEYRIDLWCATAEETQDSLEDAAILRVEPGNYFGNQKDLRLPQAERHGCCMVPQVWAQE